MNNFDRLELVDADILRAAKGGRIKDDCVHISLTLNGAFQTVLISKQHIYDSIVQSQIRKSLAGSNVGEAIKKENEECGN